jgi:hypothetical protein
MAQIQAAAKNMERQRLAQRMTDLGLGAAPSLTIQNNSMMAGQRDIGDIGRANQNYTDTVNSMIGQTNANAAAQGAGFTAGINEAKANSELDNKMQEFDRYYKLYMAKRITRNQFKAKTGLTVNGWAARRNTNVNPLDDNINPSEGINSTYEYLNYAVDQGRMSPNEALAIWKQHNGEVVTPSTFGR